MTVILLAIDALDHELVDKFDCDGFKLQTNDSLETFCYSLDEPHTTEVWPTVATGLHPRDHGVVEQTAARWNNPLFSMASYVLQSAPHSLRIKLGEIATRMTGAEFSLVETDKESIFDSPHREVHNWPGVINSHVLQNRWELLVEADDSTNSAIFDRDLLSVAAEKIGWVSEMSRHQVELAATHIHAIDIAGHGYRTDEEHYEEIYKQLETQILDLRNNLADDDELIILSDHGMGVESIEGDDPGVHSMRAFISTTQPNADLPESVFDVREWLETRIQGSDESIDTGEIDIDDEHLRDLGYL